MKSPVTWISIAGAVAIFYAIILNLTTGATAGVRQSLALESIVAAVIAVACGAFMVSRGGRWKFFAIALIGPGLFVLADSGMRLVLLLTHR